MFDNNEVLTNIHVDNKKIKYRMNSSLLRQYQIKLYKKKAIENAFGVYKDELEYVCTTRAGLLNQSQSFNFNNEEVQYPMTKTLLVRSYVPVEADDVVELKDKKYLVVGVAENLYYHNKSIQISEINE